MFELNALFIILILLTEFFVGYYEGILKSQGKNTEYIKSMNISFVILIFTLLLTKNLYKTYYEVYSILIVST